MHGGRGDQHTWGCVVGAEAADGVVVEVGVKLVLRAGQGFGGAVTSIHQQSPGRIVDPFTQGRIAISYGLRLLRSSAVSGLNGSARS